MKTFDQLPGIMLGLYDNLHSLMSLFNSLKYTFEESTCQKYIFKNLNFKHIAEWASYRSKFDADPRDGIPKKVQLHDEHTDRSPGLN